MNQNDPNMAQAKVHHDAADSAFNPVLGVPATRVLVVECDRVTQAMVRNHLAEAGYSVETASSAEESFGPLGQQ